MKAASFWSSDINPSPSLLDDIAQVKPGMLVCFFSVDHGNDPSFLKALSTKFPDAIVLGCSTAGEITSEGVSDQVMSIAAVRFDKTKIKAAHASVAGGTSAKAGQTIAKALQGDDLAGIFVLCPGVNINGSEFVQGMVDVLGRDVPVSGGLAGDGLEFKKTYTFFNGELYEDQAVGVGFYGSDVEYKTGSRGGWSPFGPGRRVTRSESNILYELDGEPALKLYKEYLGDKADNLPSSGLLYPFAILHEDHSQQGLIRTILNVDHEKGSLTLAGDLPEDSLVCLMHADIDNLIDGAKDAAVDAAVSSQPDSLALLVSCVGRKIVMTDDVVEEVDAVKRVIGKGASVAGFYSYGEISPFVLTGQPELHNQTMTVTRITER